jgi:hypothetical protein
MPNVPRDDGFGSFFQPAWGSQWGSQPGWGSPQPVETRRRSGQYYPQVQQQQGWRW